MDILGISEHRWAGYGHFSTSCGGQIIYSGRERSGQSGVAVLLSKATAKSLIGYKPVNDKIITVRLMGQAKNITLIQVYAPTSASTEEELEEFYETLQKEIDSKKRQDILIIAGDFNTKVWRMRNKEENGTVGNAGLGERNERGEIFVDFALANQLAIKNTMYQKHPRRLNTWTLPDGNTKNQIDYILLEKRWTTTMQGITTKPNADCETDHELLVATMKLKLKHKKKFTRPIRYDLQEIKEEFNIETKNRFEALLEDIEEKEPDEIANEAKRIFMETAEKHLNKRRVKKQPWMSESTLNKIKERKETKTTNGAHSNVYKAIAKEVKQMCRKDKKNYLIGKCEQLEDHMKENRSREMYKEIESLTKTFQPRLGVIKDENGETLTETEKITDRWKRYCEEIYSDNQPVNKDQSKKKRKHRR